MAQRLPTRLASTVGQLLRETWTVYLTLLKVMIPALLIVKALEILGMTERLGEWLSPLMMPLGLPEPLSMVWAATLMTNIYTGLVIFFEISRETPLTVAQVTVLGALMAVGHSLPVEGAVARKAGVPWWLTLLFRVGGAWLLGWALHMSYSLGDWLQQANHVVWEPTPRDAGLAAWVQDQAITLATIFVVILALMALLSLLRWLGIERLIHKLLYPLLRLLGVGSSAANITVIGITLGLSFGAGLLLREAHSGRLMPRDIVLTLSFLGLCHSLIEDTLLIMLLGADLSGILWARLGFALVVIALLARLPWLNRARLPAWMFAKRTLPETAPRP
ncbi:membrane protein [Litchfieldella anticariensis FP35 = DSM 16096]|uniref:Membrane protein n=1 Tax=Litchfieldella anticariensis (strain DSM 16096 / CECT 5854 / CIP 108499 / LMG 22089 / FP35) TaxID=1121939 RepID=S2L3M6_LITA3|nr:nucleoside recognition domain-containing protein [Halomonas anticariensis]EPC02344.1 membrane protein [Halomonas anticariensis FP35 = DSM 16096]